MNKVFFLSKAEDIYSRLFTQEEEKKKLFKRRVKDYADKMEINVKSISVRPMKNKWASCSIDGNLNFNKELLDLESDLSDYVIVHELLHFKVPNHGKLWKSLMSAYLGDYHKSKQILKKMATDQYYVK